MGRPRRFVILLGAAAAAVRHGRRTASGHRVPGGILIGDVGVYDNLSRLLLGPFFASPPTSRRPPPTAHECSRWAAAPATCPPGWLASTGST
jgi:hypothetical protein